jgi:phosphatidylserine decarboxylase
MRDQQFMTLMKLLPRSAISAAMGRLTRAPVPAGWHRAAIRAFARRYRVDVEEAERPIDGYRTFGEFFTRRLKPGSRPVEPGEGVVVSPVDGAVSQAGALDGDLCLQAKGISYPVGKLLGDEGSAHAFQGGSFATLYLSPRDYHRIHAPLAGQVLGYSYVPGEFWPVNPASVRTKEALFCVNERLITWMQTPAGLSAVVAVGATCVARIHAAYDDRILTHSGQPAAVHRYEQPIPVQKGGELGLFEMGSTVILLYGPGKVRWDEALQPEAAVRMGRRIGEVR